ncbi:MAG: hypothetical protein PHE73_00520 [Sulfurovaceae bacterium]|nr:hypothetical protein [Sulfurovaceae bacterium]
MKKGFLSVLLIFTLSAYANVEIKSESFQEKIINKQNTWVKAARVIPGTKVRYINTISNNGADTAENLVITNPVPNHMRYVEGSAKCSGACIITYSLNGKFFDMPAKLFMIENGQKRVAKATEYKAIRWVVQTLGAKQNSSVQFDATLE